MRVDSRAVGGLAGTVLALLAAPLAVTAGVALWFGESLLPFLLPAAGCLLLGTPLTRIGHRQLGLREAYLVVATVWLLVGVVGAVPFLIAGEGSLANPVNALFESMSGITTTGATVILDFGAYSRSVLLWRGVLQWLGGLGILILAVALLSELRVAGAQLMERESQTQDLRKLTPKIRETARLLGVLYIGLTALLVVVLLGLRLVGLAPEMDLYAAVAHALTTVSTAGFSPRPESLGAFSPAVQWVVTLFMLLGATNFVLLYHVTQGDLARLRDSEEFRFYLAVVAGAAAIVTGFLLVDDAYPALEALRHGTFQVVSIITTTGYATVDFDLWSVGAKHVLFLCMFVGGMAGSTTCSIKTVRWLVVVKGTRRDVFTEIHPDAIKPVRVSGAVVDEGTVQDIYGYVLLTLVLFALTTVAIVVDAAREGPTIGEFDAMGAAAATFLNVGPAFGVAGPFESYEPFSPLVKLLLTVLMWVGRIETIPVLVVLTRSFWRS
jgi:trk system potassium uptake protein TrkH